LSLVIHSTHENASGSNRLLTGAFLFINETPTLLGNFA